jgi:hypothetical protein
MTPTACLWVGFPQKYPVREDELERRFSPFGNICRIKAFADRSYAFVQYEHIYEADAAMNGLPRNAFGDFNVRVHYSKSDITAQHEGRPKDPNEAIKRRKMLDEKRAPPPPPPIESFDNDGWEVAGVGRRAAAMEKMRGLGGAGLSSTSGYSGFDRGYSSGSARVPPQNLGQIERRVWWGWLAKMHNRICTVRGFSGGSFIPPFNLPDTFTLSARLEMTILEQHLSANIRFSVMYLIPDDDVSGGYERLVRQLADSHPPCAGVVNVSGTNTVYLIPPSLFADKLLGRRNQPHMVAAIVPLPPPQVGSSATPQMRPEIHPASMGQDFRGPADMGRMPDMLSHSRDRQWQGAPDPPRFPQRQDDLPPDWGLGGDRHASTSGRGSFGSDSQFMQGGQGGSGYGQSMPPRSDLSGGYDQRRPDQGFGAQGPMNGMQMGAAPPSDFGGYVQHNTQDQMNPAGGSGTSGEDDAVFRNTLMLAAALIKQQQGQ